MTSWTLAAREQRPLTFTLHPEILGRPHRLTVLDELLRAAREHACEVVTLERSAHRFQRDGMK